MTPTRARLRWLPAAGTLLCAVLATGCTSAGPFDATSQSGDEATLPGSPVRDPGARMSRTAAAQPGSPSSEPSSSEPPPSTGGQRPDGSAAMRTVRQLARGGPREATSAAFRRAAVGVQQRFTELGYFVQRQRFGVPAGESWGVRVGNGTTFNVVATPPGFDPTRPHVVVGAHLDTVPQAPGAEDNASGVAVVLETARLAAVAGTRLPVVWVAFGAEEPRGPGDDEHHFGSQEYVRRLDRDERAALRGMVSLDRVGVPGRVPVCTGGLSPLRVRQALLTAARDVGVPARRCENRTSDHWPFEKAGLTVARLGGIDYAGYHSPRDRPPVVSPRQLDRVGRVLWEWLRDG